MDDLTKWKVHGPVASLKTETATWDPNQQYWEPARYFTIASFRPDGTISSSDSYNSDGSIAHSKWLYDPSGRLMEYRSWMNDEPADRSLYLYDEAGRHVRTVRVSQDGSETDTEICSYDAEGRRTKVSPLSFRAGNVSYGIEGTNMGLGAPGATKMVTIYDHNDLPIKEVFEDANQNPIRQVIMRRDSAGRLVKVEMHMGGQSIFGHRDQPVSPECEKAVSLIMQAFGGIFSNTTFSYDGQGRLLERTNSMFNLGGHRTTYRYDDGDNPIEETTEHRRREASLDDDGSLRYTPDTVTSQHVRFEYRYDAYGNWVERTVLVRHEVNAEFEPSNIERRAITYH